MQLSFIGRRPLRPARFACVSALFVVVSLLVPSVIAAGERGYAGLEIRDLLATEAEALGWEAPRGAFVETLLEDGPALDAGVQAGDIIVSVDGMEMESSDAVVDAMVSHLPGARVNLRLLRDGKERRLTMELRARPTHHTLPEKCAKFVPAVGRSIEVPCPNAGE